MPTNVLQGQATAGPCVLVSAFVTPEISVDLKMTMRDRDVNVTQAMRDMIRLYKLISDEIEKGNKIVIVEGPGLRLTRREITLKDPER